MMFLLTLPVDPLVVDDLQTCVATEGEPVAEDDEGETGYEVDDFPPGVVDDNRVATVEELREQACCQSTKHEQQDAEAHPCEDGHDKRMLVVDAAKEKKAGVLHDDA